MLTFLPYVPFITFLPLLLQILFQPFLPLDSLYTKVTLTLCLHPMGTSHRGKATPKVTPYLGKLCHSSMLQTAKTDTKGKISYWHHFGPGSKEVCPPTITLCVYATCAMGSQTKLPTKIRSTSHTRLEKNPRVLCPLFWLDVIALENTGLWNHVAAAGLLFFCKISLSLTFRDKELSSIFSGLHSNK